MASWPGTLPSFILREGFSEGFKDLVLRSAMDVGPKKKRLRSTAAPEPNTYPVELTSAQVDIFKTWFYDDATGVAGGSLNFTMTNPRTGNTDTYGFTKTPDPVTPSGYNTYILILPLELLP